jgi:hypothetical protein
MVDEEMEPSALTKQQLAGVFGDIHGAYDMMTKEPKYYFRVVNSRLDVDSGHTGRHLTSK